MVERVNNITDSSSEGIKNAFEGKENPKLFSEECKFVGEKTLSVGEDKRDSEKIIITADRILVAAGTRPRIPNIYSLKDSGYLTSDEIFRIKKQPKILTIIGGGYIACELAHFFGALGTEVNIFQRRELLIPEEDEEVSQRFTEIFSEKYNIVTDKYLETNVKGIFALGDIVGRYLFKHNANNEAQYAYNNIISSTKKIPVNYYAMPHAIFSSPQVAGVGLRE